MNYILRVLRIILFVCITASTVSLQAFFGPFAGASIQQDVAAIKKEINSKLGQLDKEHNLKVVQSDKILERAAKLFGGKHVIFWYEQARMNTLLQSDEQEVKDLIESVSYYVLNQAIFAFPQHLGERRAWFENKTASDLREESLKGQHRASQLLAKLYYFEADEICERAPLSEDYKEASSPYKTKGIRKHAPFREKLTYLALMILEINKRNLSNGDREAAIAVSLNKMISQMIALDKQIGSGFADEISELGALLQYFVPKRVMSWHWMIKVALGSAVAVAVPVALCAAGLGLAWYNRAAIRGYYDAQYAPQLNALTA